MSAQPSLPVRQAAALDCVIARLTALPADPPHPARPAPVDALVDLVIARPWRRSAVDAATLDDIQGKIGQAVKDDRPVEFAVPFGGYKGWRMRSAPHPDWAEVFWLDYLRSYAERIAAVHPAGVVISFSHVGGVLWWINGTPPEDEAAYLGAFARLLADRSTPRLRFRLVDLAQDLGGPDRLMALLRQRESAMPTPTGPELRSAQRNLVPADQGRDRDPATDPLAHVDAVAVERAARRCAAMMSLEARRDFNKHGPRIQITHIRGSTLSLHLGSCRSAIAQPWVAQGHLEWRPGAGDWLERMTADPTFRSTIDLPLAHRLHGISPALARIPLRTPDVADQCGDR